MNGSRIVKGPFNLKWGDNVIAGVETVEANYEVDEQEFTTVQGKTIRVDGAHSASVTLTLLETDLAALAVLLPQYFVANGQAMSTGETVNNADGAVDIVPSDCDVSDVYNHLDIISCGSGAQVTRLVNARTRLAGVDMSDNIRRISIEFIGESGQDEATMQFFKQGTINVVS